MHVLGSRGCRVEARNFGCVCVAVLCCPRHEKIPIFVLAKLGLPKVGHAFGQSWCWPNLVWPKLVLAKVSLAKVGDARITVVTLVDVDPLCPVVGSCPCLPRPVLRSQTSLSSPLVGACSARFGSSSTGPSFQRRYRRLIRIAFEAERRSSTTLLHNFAFKQVPAMSPSLVSQLVSRQTRTRPRPLFRPKPLQSGFPTMTNSMGNLPSRATWARIKSQE